MCAQRVGDRQYDHECRDQRGETLVGPQGCGPSDASVLAPKLGSSGDLRLLMGLIRYGMGGTGWPCVLMKRSARL